MLANLDARRGIFVLTLLASIGCDWTDKVFGRDELHILRRNQGQWRGMGIKDYDYTYQRLCWCEFTGPVTVSVRGGLVTAVTDSNGQPPQTFYIDHVWPTVDSLFVWIERDMGYGYHLDITYDGAFHFPGRVAGDIPGAIDDEFTLTALKLVRVTP